MIFVVKSFVLNVAVPCLSLCLALAAQSQLTADAKC